MSSSCASPLPERRLRRPFVGVLFRCCRVYNRAYLRPDLSAYDGRCPRCGRRVLLTVSPAGTSSRFFEAGR